MTHRSHRCFAEPAPGLRSKMTARQAFRARIRLTAVLGRSRLSADRPRRALARLALIACVPRLAACSNVSRFDTGTSDAYCGTIVGATFVRQGFTRQIQAELRIDTSKLNTTPARLTSHRDDAPCEGRPLFESAPLRTPVKLESDPLSQLEFGDDRELNWMSWVHSSCNETYLAVVSLMHDDSVELRLLRSPTTADEPESGALGVFPMLRSRRGCGND